MSGDAAACKIAKIPEQISLDRYCDQAALNIHGYVTKCTTDEEVAKLKKASVESNAIFEANYKSNYFTKRLQVIMR